MLQLIFENLEMPNLFNVIESDKTVLEPVVWAFRISYAQKVIVIDGESFINKTEIFAVERDRLIIKDYQMAVNVLKYFGSSISKLEVNYKSLLLREIEAINRMIDEKCWEKLTEVHFTCDSNELEGLSSVFPHVVNVTFANSHISSNALRLDKLYPQMRELYLFKVFSQKADYLFHPFEHLETFTVNICSLSGWIAESKLGKMFEKNPQIKSVNILKTSHKVVEEMSVSLLRLENLELPSLLGSFFNTHSNISFNRVKRFKLHIFQSLHVSPKFIPFQFNNQLQEFELNWFRPEGLQISNEWLKFIEMQTSLKRLKVTFNSFDPHVTIAYLTDLNLPNLQIFQMQNVNLHINELNRLILPKGKWKRLHEIHLIAATQSFLDEIQQYNTTHWSIGKVEAHDENELFDIVIKVME